MNSPASDSIPHAPIRLAVQGAAGRMGRRIVALAAADRTWRLVVAADAVDHPELGRDAGELAGVGPLGVPLAATLDGAADCVIDFSVPAAADETVRICQAEGWPLVMATTGLSAAQHDALRAAAERIPLVWAPNMSLAVNLTMRLATLAARTLRDVPGGADVEILERHHRFKKDAPSGTALHFGALIAAEMGQTSHRHGREGLVGERPHSEIGYHAVRVGDDVGQHTIVFGMLGETLELTVRASNRDCYALGALQAAAFALRQPPGLYSMVDVLGL